MSSKQLVILGANDFEMREIKNLLLDNGYTVFQGLDNSTLTECNKYSAYHIFDIHNHYRFADYEIIFIECRPYGGFPKSNYIYIDHHMPYNEGFDYGGDKFMNASSIGRVYELITGEKIRYDHNNGWMIGNNKIKKEHVFIAASDHCMVAAMKGLCCGVDKDEFHIFRKSYLPENSKVGSLFIESELREDVELLKRFPKAKIGNEEFIVVIGYTQIRYIFDACNELEENMVLVRPFKSNIHVRFFSFKENYIEILNNTSNLIAWSSKIQNSFRGILIGDISKKEFKRVFGDEFSNILA